MYIYISLSISLSLYIYIYIYIYKVVAFGLCDTGGALMGATLLPGDFGQPCNFDDALLHVCYYLIVFFRFLLMNIVVLFSLVIVYVVVIRYYDFYFMTFLFVV